VAATDELQNADEALSSLQRERLKQARSAAQPVLIVTQAEAELAEKSRSEAQKTWHFKATNVRDFAWASSRKFIWDAQGFKKGETDTMAMSFYPKEGNPLGANTARRQLFILSTSTAVSALTIHIPWRSRSMDRSAAWNIR